MGVEPVEMKVTTKKEIGFYIRSAKSFMEGTEDKEGNKKPAVDNLNISGTGNAINAAVATAAALESEGLGTITKIETSYPKLGEEGKGHGVARIHVEIVKK